MKPVIIAVLVLTVLCQLYDCIILALPRHLNLMCCMQIKFLVLIYLFVFYDICLIFLS